MVPRTLSISDWMAINLSRVILMEMIDRTSPSGVHRTASGTCCAVRRAHSPRRHSVSRTIFPQLLISTGTAAQTSQSFVHPTVCGIGSKAQTAHLPRSHSGNPVTRPCLPITCNRQLGSVGRMGPMLHAIGPNALRPISLSNDLSYNPRL